MELVVLLLVAAVGVGALAAAFGAGMAVGSHQATHTVEVEDDGSYRRGFSEGVQHGFEQVAATMKQVLGQKRFKEITKEIRVAVDDS